MLRTILLETGNWNDAGHPTGRKVSFVNSFAIEGHYFNFTTTGQWLWDELDVLIPAGEDPYFLLNSVLKLVAEQTQSDAPQAEQEWRRATHSSVTQIVFGRAGDRRAAHEPGHQPGGALRSACARSLRGPDSSLPGNRGAIA